MTDRIDSHHHLWKFNHDEYGWIDDRMSLLRRDFTPTDLKAELASTGFDGAVAVQVRQILDETTWLLDLANDSSLLCGVVGWAPIASDDFGSQLDRLREYPKLKGLRHIVQAEPDENFILREDFNRGVRKLLSTGLVYDILIYERHLPQAIQFVDLHPNQLFVVDHIAKPRIADGQLQPWRENMFALARRENVYCKVSGMVTEADWENWTPVQLEPYWDSVVAAFGASRLMFGSDWPVCLVASRYAAWLEIVQNWATQLSESEQDRLFGGTAAEVYRLD
jgi:L-fucono-1,5-lactonase